MQPTPVNNIVLLQQIGEVVYKARRRRKETLATVSKNTGLSRAVLSQIEKGVYLLLDLQTVHMLVGYYKIGR